MQGPVILTLCAAMSWWGLNIFLGRLFSGRLSGHLVSLIHSTLICLMIIRLRQAEGSDFLEADFTKPTQPHEDALIAISLGYFLYDTAIMRKTLPNSPMVLHHLGSCVVLAESIRSNLAGNAVLLVLLLLEFPNPLLHLRRILQHYNLDYGPLYFCLEIVYLATFILSRFIWAGKLSLDIYTGRIKCSVTHFYITVFYNTVSVMFLSLVILYIGKEYFNKCKNINIIK